LVLVQLGQLVREQVGELVVLQAPV
jgi:hypothetical protein